MNTELIKQPYSATFRHLPRSRRRGMVINSDFTIAFQTDEGATALQRVEQLKKLERLGIKFFSIDVIFACVLEVMEKLGIAIPYTEYIDGKSMELLTKKEKQTVITEQKLAIERIFSSFEISLTDEESIKIQLFSTEEDNLDITEEIYRRVTVGDEKINFLHKHQGLMNRALRLLKTMAIDIDSFGMVVASPSQGMTTGAVIGVNGISDVPQTWRKDADKVITGEPSQISYGVLRELIRHQMMNSRREALVEGISNGEVILEDEFKVEEWPRHALMEFIKDQANSIIIDETEKSGILCDEQDIRYQTIFRLTTFPFNKIFQNGDELVTKLREKGVYEDWHKILELETTDFVGFNLNEELLRIIVREQLVIINDRLAESILPVKEILTKSGIFAEVGWRMEKQGGQIYAVRYDLQNREVGRKLIRFEMVEPAVATAFHQAFHYIHTPRTGQAYGLFLENEALPFSVLALEPIDRGYKNNMLLMQGYDPQHCLDLARLYSRPGTPKNTSSTMFSLVFSELKTNQPEIQAVLSAFMPTYATGKSMLSGGFDNPVLIKPTRHYFGKKVIGGQVVFEHLTRRRIKEAQEIISIHPDMPMLPVVELMTRLKNPRFMPLDEIKGKMVVVSE